MIHNVHVGKSEICATIGIEHLTSGFTIGLSSSFRTATLLPPEGFIYLFNFSVYKGCRPNQQVGMVGSINWS